MRDRALGLLSGAVFLFVAACDSSKRGAEQPSSSAGTQQRTPIPDRRTNGDGSAFTLFETGQVRPLALSANGDLLFAANTPHNRLEIFSTGSRGGRGVPRQARDNALTAVASIPVGLEPIAVAARSQTEVWIVNHLSDSVSIVDISDLSTARVVRTLLVGDEPRDIVFAGPNRSRAFITTAHRGQRLSELGRGPQLTTPGVGRADVWVFDADNLGDLAGGRPLTIVTLFSDTPRALAVTADGNTVYAAAFHSGNRTTTLGAGAIDSRGLPPPRDNFEHFAAPRTGLIVKFRQSRVDGQMHWLDQREVAWDDKIRFSLPDKDVFAIDASANPPVERPGPDGSFSGVGTVLFNMAVNPVNGKVYVSNTEANNETRFEGPGAYLGQLGLPSPVRGHLAESRISVLGQGQVLPRHLNKHIDYSQCCAPVPNPESIKSLAFPHDMAVSGDGRTLYVAAFGSSKIGIFDTGELETDTFVPDRSNQIEVSGGGPSGLALDDGRGRLYVLTRFDNSISVIDTAGRAEVLHVAMYNPEPQSVTNGRRFLYDASLTSSHGDSACASCHISGDFDSLAWDLGDPDGARVSNPNPFEVGVAQPFHPLKGPMTTQSLRGMDNHGPMHWRGDRTGAYDAPSVQPNSGAFDEDAAFKKFNIAFAGLLGRSEPLTDEQMQAFTDFILQLTYPPNPIRQLDDSLTPEQQAGRDFYFGAISDLVRNCNGCHVLDRDGNRGLPGVVRPGFFGTDGKSSEENEPQKFKVAHLRNVYQKVGMFGMAPQPDFFPEQGPPRGEDIPFMGEQVRGFGMLHDGSVDTVFHFHGAGVFERIPGINPGGIPFGPAGYVTRRALESFVLAFDSNLAPIVGQQMTLGPPNFENAEANARIDLLEARAAAGDCDLVVKGFVQGQRAAFRYNADGTFARSRTGDTVSEVAVRASASGAGGELTFTCVPPGSGSRIADEL
jgi:DNA-binding beta-propeller fold protein YncE